MSTVSSLFPRGCVPPPPPFPSSAPSHRGRVLAGVTVKHKGRAVQVPCEAQKVTVQALTEACGEPIKGLQSFVTHTHTHPTTPPLIPRSHLYLLQRSEAPEPRQQRRHLRGPQQRHLPHCPRRVHPRARSCGRHAGRPGPAAAHHLVRQPSELPEAAAALRAPLLHPARCRPSARSALVCTTAAASRTAPRTAARTGRSGAKGACAKAGTPAARCTQDAQR